MLLIKATILTLSLFSGLSSAQPSTLPSDGDGLQLIEGQPVPNSWYSYDLDDVDASTLATLKAAYAQDTNTTTNALAARTQIKVCESGLSQGSQCATIASAVFTITAAIAGAAWSYSHQKDCSYHSGEVDGWKWEFHATGRNCDTTAQQSTIQGAIYHYLEKIESNKVCGTQCLSLTHGGTYAGYLKIGKAAYYDSSAYCGPSLNFESCASGGKNDL